MRDSRPRRRLAARRPWTVDELYDAVELLGDAGPSTCAAEVAGSLRARGGRGGALACHAEAGPAGDLDWVVEGEVDLAASTEGHEVLRLVEIRRRARFSPRRRRNACGYRRDDLWAARGESTRRSTKEEKK